MTTQFFDRQEAARTNTWWLVTLFVAAVVGLVATTSGIAYVASQNIKYEVDQGEPIPPAMIAAVVGVATAFVILLGSLFQVIALRAGGGTRVAESLGGRQLTQDSEDLGERRLLNIVEEMAIASGTPVPPVYLLDEPGVNAFAAGYRPGDAVIGVTRGAVEQLNREQLQGVIAHEFSHVLNGDMRMSIRMIGILHGILLLSLIGHMLLRSLRFVGARSSNSDRGNGGIVIVMLVSGLVLVILGAIGSFLGGLIKASVSRQREYLADASAVQFTRNPPGLAGALKRIGGMSQHGLLKHPNAAVASHMYFSQGVYEGLTGLLATHPPLEKRIRSIEPTWDGTYPAVAESAVPIASGRAKGSRRLAEATAGLVGESANPARDRPMGSEDFSRQSAPAPSAFDRALVPVPLVMSGAEQVGEPAAEHRRYAAALLREIDRDLSTAAAQPYSARALVFALLMDHDEPIRQVQFAALDRMITPDVVALTRKLLPKVMAAPDAARLPLVDLALPMLRMMTAPQYATFIKAFREMVNADQRLTVFEWALSQVLVRNLRREFEARESTATLYNRLNKLVPEVSVLLSVMARVGTVPGDADAAFRKGVAELKSVQPVLLPASEVSFTALDRALSKLARTSPHSRHDLLMACAATVCSDGIVRVKEAELIRGIADLLDCPMPPLCGQLELEYAS